jgi:2'-5' RNA ligase
MKHDHSTTQLNLPDHLAQHALQFASQLPEEHLAEKGRESEPHVTLKWGLHNTGHSPVTAALKDEHPAQARFGHTRVFETPDADVLHVEVTGHDLHRLHRKLNRLPHDDSHAEYSPHMTLAYMARGTGHRYAGQAVPRLTGRTAVFREVTFSSKNGRKTRIPLEPATD